MGYDAEYYKGELALTKKESILLLVSHDQAEKIPQLKSIDWEILMKTYCEILRKNLNTLLHRIAYLEYLKRKNPNG